MTTMPKIADEGQAEYKTEGGDPGRPWRCLECGAVLGYVCREPVEWRDREGLARVNRWLVLHPVDERGRINIRLRFIGRGDVVCPACETVRAWEWDK